MTIRTSSKPSFNPIIAMAKSRCSTTTTARMRVLVLTTSTTRLGIDSSDTRLFLICALVKTFSIRQIRSPVRLPRLDLASLIGVDIYVPSHGLQLRRKMHKEIYCKTPVLIFVLNTDDVDEFRLYFVFNSDIPFIGPQLRFRRRTIRFINVDDNLLSG